MKRRVGKYKDKIIVEGDKNEFKPHEVSIKELAGTDNMGGGSNNNGIGIEYYRLIGPITENEVLAYAIIFSPCFFNCIHGESSSNLYNHSIANSYLIVSSDRCKILAIAFIDIKSIFDDGGGNPVIYEGSLQERADYIATMIGIPKINIYDYLEPITKEEFYNIKPE